MNFSNLDKSYPMTMKNADFNVFLVTSVLEPVGKPLIYAPRRSRYTPLQRLHQLEGTVNSIRRFFPDPNENKIILLEGSSTISSPVKEKLSILGVDEIVYGYSPYVDSYFKCQGEASLLRKGIEIVRKKYYMANRIFKISGRYELTNGFKKHIFMEENKTIFKKVPTDSVFYEPKPCVFTFFYCVSKTDLKLLDSVCKKILENDEKESIEVIFYRELKDIIRLVPESQPLGVKGFISHSGRFVEN